MVLINLERRSLRTVCSEVFALVISAFVYSLAFPGFFLEHGIGALAFISLIPVFIVIRNTSWKLIAPYGFLFGFVFYVIFNYWLKTFHPLAILIMPFIKGFEMILLFPVLKLADSLFRKKGYIVQSIVWVAYAYLCEQWFAGFPYGTICYAVYSFLPFIQIAEITGAWGIVFLMIFPQAFIARYLHDYIKGEHYPFISFIKSNLIEAVVYVVLLALTFAFGFSRISYWSDREPERVWKVATVQHNHDSWEGGLPTYIRNFNNLRRYTLEAVTRSPDIVVWSETAFIPSIDWNMRFQYPGNEGMRNLISEFVAFGEGLSVPLLTGNADGEPKYPDKGPFLEDGSQNRDDYNSVILFDDGSIVEKYRKQHLVPFTEHFPYERQLPWLYNMLKANGYHWWEKGTEPVVFETDGVKFSTPICFEDVFGVISAEFVANGADLIINMTNDSWSQSIAAERQHQEIATFRSIETRKSMVRGTNSGITCLVTPEGRVHDEMEPFTMGYTIYDVPIYTHDDNPDTFYVRHIDLFGKMAVYASVVILVAGCISKVVEFVQRRRRKEND